MAENRIVQWVKKTTGGMGKSVSLEKMYEAGRKASRPRGKK